MTRRIDTQAVIDSVRLAEQGSDPSTPASGFGSLYAKAASLNYIDDAGSVMAFTPLANWTPTVTQSGSVAVTVNMAKQCKIGGLQYVTGQLTVTGSGSAGNDILIGNLPQNTVNGVNGCWGSAYISDEGTGFYSGSLRGFANATMAIVAHLENNDVGSDPSFALAANDVIAFMALYVPA